jgi:hypothetical protein
LSLEGLERCLAAATDAGRRARYASACLLVTYGPLARIFVGRAACRAQQRTSTLGHWRKLPLLSDSLSLPLGEIAAARPWAAQHKH